ncbi:MAG: HipA N-terminal domain-containing protein [Chitinophagaceae bacterium]
MRQGKVYNNDDFAGVLTETNEGEYIFHYVDDYFFNTTKRAISLTLSKNKQHHRSNKIFPFFFNLLSEGENRKLQCRVLKIDGNDHFGLLLKTASEETIGAVRVVEFDEKE